MRDGSKITELNGEDGRLEAVTLLSSEPLQLSFRFCFLGALTCTDWLGEAVARGEHAASSPALPSGTEDLLETSVPGIYAAGDDAHDPRSDASPQSGEGTIAVRLVHARLASMSSALRGDPR